MPATPSATVVVVARDRWTQAPATIESLLAKTDRRFPVVVVDGGARRSVAAALDRFAASGRVHVARRPRFLASNEARNVGIDGVDTEWVAIVENDVELSDGWLDVLIAAGEKLDAATVYPAYLEHGPHGLRVHGLGAELEVTGAPGRQRLREVDHDLRRLWRVIGAELEPVERVQAEPHAIVIRREMLDQMGGFDEGFLSWFEHLDLALWHRRLGAPAWMIPEVTCTYLAPPPVALADRATFELRWSADWLQRSRTHLCATWGFEPDDPGWAMHERYRTSVRRGALTPWSTVNALIDRGAAPIDRVIARRWHASAGSA